MDTAALIGQEIKIRDIKRDEDRQVRCTTYRITAAYPGCVIGVDKNGYRRGIPANELYRQGLIKQSPELEALKKGAGRSTAWHRKNS